MYNYIRYSVMGDAIIYMVGGGFSAPIVTPIKLPKVGKTRIEGYKKPSKFWSSLTSVIKGWSLITMKFNE